MRKSNRPITKLGTEGRQQQSSERTKINALNKGRSKRMEDWVAAQYPGGKRVPMSGAAKAWKGDVIVEFQNHAGKFLIECKLSSAYKESDDSPTIRMDFKWLPKLQEEVESTNSKFGILLFYYFKTNSRYVLIRPQDLELLVTRYEIEDRSIVVDILSSGVVADYRTSKGGKDISAYNLTHKEVERILSPYSLYRAARINTVAGEYILMPFKDFKELTIDL